MEIQGKIIAVLPEKSGTSARGGWKSQQYVLETEEQYPKRCLFDVFGEDKIKQYALQEQMRVKVSYDPRADEKDGHWYGSNRAWNVESLDTPLLLQLHKLIFAQRIRSPVLSMAGRLWI